MQKLNLKKLYVQYTTIKLKNKVLKTKNPSGRASVTVCLVG